MAKQVTTILQGYNGGIANSAYDPLSTQTYQTSKNLDVFTNRRVLRPRVKIAGQAFSPALTSSKIEFFHKASDGYTYWFGNDTNNVLRAWRGDIPTTAGTITLTTVGTSTNAGSAPDQLTDYANTLQGYHHVAELAGYLLFWAGNELCRITLGASPTFSDDPFSWTVANNTGHPIFTHEGQRRAFIGVNNLVYTLDSTTVSGSADPTLALTIDPRYIIKSFAPYGRFVLIGCIDKKDNGTSKIFVYDGTATTVDDMIDLGDTGLQAVRNVNGIIHVIAANVTVGFPEGYIRVYLLSGNSFLLGDEIVLTPGAESNTTNRGIKLINLIDDAAVDVWGDRIYFACRGYTANTDNNYINIPNGVYAYGKLEADQPRIATLDLTTATAADAHSFTCLKLINGVIAVAFNNNTTWYVEHQLANSTFGTKSAAGVYETNIFPLDGKFGEKYGKIESIEIPHEVLPASCGFTVAIKHYGNYEISGSVGTDSYTDLVTPQGSGSSTGKTQSTTSTTFTRIMLPNDFDRARFAQLRISYDEVSGTSAPGILISNIVINSIIDD